MGDARLSELTAQIPDELVEAITRRVLERVGSGPPAQPEPWIGVDQAAEHLACPRSRIYSLVHRKDSTRIPHRKEGSRLLFRRSALDCWLEEQHE
jgi:excisionase family DNA binding protein